MKILLISSRFHPFTGGVENVVLNLAKELKAKGHEVLVVASKMGKAKRKRELVEGIKVQRVWMNLPRSVPGYIAFPLRFGIGLIGLIRLIRNFGPDVINYHFPDDSSVYVYFSSVILKERKRLKNLLENKEILRSSDDLRAQNNGLVVNIHGNDLQVFGKKPWYQFFLKKLIKKAKTIIVNSTYIKKNLQSHFPAAKEKTKIIPNAVDEKFFGLGDDKNNEEEKPARGETSPDQSGEVRESGWAETTACAGCPLAQAGACGPQAPEGWLKQTSEVEELANRKPYILYLGRLVPKKGVDVLIEAYKKAVNNLESNLVIVGDGQERAKIENMIKEKNLENRIHLVGFKTGNELLQYIDNARFAVIPSRREPFGIVALELAAAGKPIIASNTGGLTEILEDEKTALLFENNENSTEIAEKIIKLEADTELRRTLAENAKEMAKGYRWETVAETYLETYEKGLGTRD